MTSSGAKSGPKRPRTRGRKVGASVRCAPETSRVASTDVRLREPRRRHVMSARVGELVSRTVDLPTGATIYYELRGRGATGPVDRWRDGRRGPLRSGG